MKKKAQDYLFYICSVFLIFSAICYSFEWSFIPYIYAVAGAGVAIYFLSNPYRGDNRRLKRLNIQQAIAAIMLPLSSYLMFRGQNEWYVCLFVSALLMLYIVFVREYEEKKSNKRTENK